MAYEYYMKLEKDGKPLPGCKKKGHEQEMICTAIQMASSVAYDANENKVTGQRQHEPIFITKEFSEASPEMLMSHWSGKQDLVVTFTIVTRTTDGTKEHVLETIKIEGASIVSYKRYTQAAAKDRVRHDTEHMEEIGFVFKKITVEHIPVDTTNKKMASDDYTVPNIK